MFEYLQKPCELDKIIETIDSARDNKIRAMAHHEIPYVEKRSFIHWLKGSHNSRPGFIILGIIIFAGLFLMPVPSGLLKTLSFSKTGQISDMNSGYAEYSKLKNGESIAEFYSSKYKVGKTYIDKTGQEVERSLTAEEAGYRALIMLGILIVAALFWATGAVPIGITALLVGVLMYFSGILKPDDTAAAYAKDAVIFIFGVLGLATAISKTGLDRRIGMLLLGSSKSIPRYLFLFIPLLSISCSFLSEHALVAFIMPVIMIVYLSSVRNAGVKVDHKLAVLLVLSLTFAANAGGPGSPAAGGRNAVMVGILADYGNAPSFAQWVYYGLPNVPVMALSIGLFFYLVLYRKLKVKELNISSILKQASYKI